MRTIMLIDNRFPFNNGEPFLENEIKTLEENFDNVYIVPTSAIDRAITVSLNEKTIVYPSSFHMSRLLSFVYLVKAIFSHEIWNEFHRLKAEKKLHMKEIRRLINFWHLASYRSNEIHKWLRKSDLQNPDIIYAYWADVCLLTAVQLKHYIEGACVISRAHGHDLYLERNDGYLPLRSFLFKNTDLIFPVSEQGRKYLNKHYVMFKDKFITSYLGTLDYGPSELEKHDKFRIVSCSNVVELKRIERIIDSIALIKEVEIEWHHFGDGPLFERIRDYAFSKLSKGQYCFHGRVTNKELLSWYSTNYVDVFVNVSTTEGLPVSIMEAMSFGIPVIATDVGGTSEIVNDRVNGYLLSSDFKDMELRDAIVKIASLSEEDSKSLRIEARNTWTKKFSAVSNYKAFYKTICDYAH